MQIENDRKENYNYGFRPGHSCTTVLQNIPDDILQSTDSGKCTGLILLQYS